VTDCIFCEVVAGTAPSERVGENDRALALMDINPAAEGHTLVISKVHAEDVWDLSLEDGVAAWSLAMRVSTAIREALGPDGLTMFQANRRAGWQDVFHFHLHLVPRWDGDSLVRPWQSSSELREGNSYAAAKIRSRL